MIVKFLLSLSTNNNIVLVMRTKDIITMQNLLCYQVPYICIIYAQVQAYSHTYTLLA